MSEHRPQVKKRNRKVVMFSLFTVLGMCFFFVLMVPMYDVLSDLFGINGKTDNLANATSKKEDLTRTVTVQFLANKNQNLPWQFYPKTKKVIVHPGENKRVAFFVKNYSGKVMTVHVVPSISPGRDAKYFKKTECFCFEPQTLKSKESMDLPLVFHLDNSIPRNVHVLTVSYTLFDITDTTKKTIKNSGNIRG